MPFRVAQQKTAVKLMIPIHDALHRALLLAKRDHAPILVTNYGERFSVKGIGQMISAAIREADCPSAVKRMAFTRWPRDASPKPDVQ